MADLLLPSLRGGLNEDSPTSIADDQCTVARNVEFWMSQLGERRPGALAIGFGASPLAGCNRVVWMHRHLPTPDQAQAQLWAIGIKDSPASVVCAYKKTDGTWATVTMPDALTVNGVSEYQIQSQSVHGKLFIAYDSSVDRLHVWDNGATALRRAGLAQSGMIGGPFDSGSGTFTGTRYYRARFTVQVAGVTTRRSEPGLAAAFTPSAGVGGALIGRPALINEGETHWELEASVDNANFYRVFTSTFDTVSVIDTTPYEQGYAQTYPLSDDSGAYTVLPSVRLLTVVDDRLMGGGSFEVPAQGSVVLWTPVFGDPTGVGNDERYPIASNNALNLDSYEGGGLTGLSATTNGYVFATKWNHVYQLTGTGDRQHAYEAIPLTKQRGAIYGSLFEGLDAVGNPTPFLLDPDIGPCTIGPRGVEPCGADIRRTWKTINRNARKVIARGLFYPEKKQAHWWVATVTDSLTVDAPSLRLVLHTEEFRDTPDGMRRGWALWDGSSARALACCLFAENSETVVADGNKFSTVLVPFIGLEGNGLIWRTGVGSKDNSANYTAKVATKPFVAGSLLNDFEVLGGAIVVSALAGADLDVVLTANMGNTVAKTVTIALDALHAAPRLLARIDNLALAELLSIQVTFSDSLLSAKPVAQWAVDACALRIETGSRA